MNETPEIVLTGGPCAGKTSALSHIQSWFMDRGIRVYLVPEVATMLIQGSVPDIADIATNDLAAYLHFQRHLIEMEFALRKCFRQFAQGFSKRAVIIYDRGPMDGAAYVDPKDWIRMIRARGFTSYLLRDSYTAVIHLVTAAQGAEEYYTTENNSARNETLELARELDQKTQNAWLGHERLRIIGNEPPGFDIKMKRVIAAVARIVGIPAPLEIERKFLLKEAPPLSAIEHRQTVDIEQIYLHTADNDEQVRIRKRTAADGSSKYYQTVKTETGVSGVRRERETIITAADYNRLSHLQQPGTRRIRKTRTCFVWREQYFELDLFKEPPGIIYLELELTEANDRIEIPPFIKIDRDVTDEPGYSNYDLARS